MRLSLKPYSLSNNAWCYEEKGGLLFIHSIYDGTKYLRTEQVLIPTKKIREFLRRHDENNPAKS